MLTKLSFAEEISATSSKNYEAQTIKKDNEIEIRLVPKNPPPKVEKNSENEDSESDDEADTDQEEMVYEKNVEGGNLSAKQLADIKTKNANDVRENSLQLWREEQKRMRDERIKARKEEARKKYQAQKERSVIKEIENLNQKLKAEQKLKNNQINNANQIQAPVGSVPTPINNSYQIQPSNTTSVPTANSSSGSVVNSGTMPSSPSR